MSKRFLPVLLVLTAACLFVTFQTEGSNNSHDNPKTKNERILRNVGLLLEEGHYSPRKINDSFSQLVLKDFIKDLDDDKFIFLQSDIDSFKKFENVIDDEIHGNSELKSFYYIATIYTKRLAETAEYADILSKPFDFTKNDSIVVNRDKLDFVKTPADKYELWNKRLKFLTLSKYMDLLEERKKNKGKKDFVVKADTTLEREARNQIKKQIGRYFTTLKNHNTSDEIFSTFVNTITNAMDPHTSYFPPIDARSFNESMS
ncbi:MAG: tail-specific protease, partial [Sphingobacteriales bacterium]|nr:tail-specific protease [Sphingobacteriales bacterium]